MDVNTDLLNEIKKIIEESTKRSVEEGNKQQTEVIKAHIDIEIQKINQKLEEQTEKYTELKKNYDDLKVKQTKLEKEVRRNNIIIFGLQLEEGNLLEFTINSLNNLLQLQLSISDINNVFAIGKNINRPIIVKFISFFKKQEVLRNCKKLKGTSVYISEELSPEERCEIKFLRTHLKEARAKNLDAYIKNHNLYVNGKKYTPQQLKQEQLQNIREGTSDSEIVNSGKPIEDTNKTEESDIEDQINSELEEVFESGKLDDELNRKKNVTDNCETNVKRSARINSLSKTQGNQKPRTVKLR